MSVLRKRLEKLEEAIGKGPARQIVLRCGRDLAEGEAEAFLRSQGIETTKSDLIVVFKTFYEGEDGNHSEPAPLSLLAVNQMQPRGRS